MKPVVFAIVAVVLVSCGGGDAPSDPSSTELGTQTQAQTAVRPARCVFHQPPRLRADLNALFPNPDWDLRDLPAACFVRQKRIDGSLASATFDSEGRPLSGGNEHLGFTYAYDRAGHPVKATSVVNGHSRHGIELELVRDGVVRTAVSRGEDSMSGLRYDLTETLVHQSPDCSALEYEKTLVSPSEPKPLTAHVIERYDANGWPVSVETRDFDGTTRVESVARPAETLRRDAAGRVVYRRDGPRGDELFSEFDAAGRLARRKKVTRDLDLTQTLSYDHRGRLWRSETTEVSKSTGRRDELGTFYVEYARDGTVRERVDLGSDGSVDMEYVLRFDEQGRLVSKYMSSTGFKPGVSTDEVERWDFGYCP